MNLNEKINNSILLLKEFEQCAIDIDLLDKNGYFLGFSGGKDSCVIKELAKMAGVKFKAYYSVTTIDPPEVVSFIRRFHPDVIFLRPKRSFFRAFVDSHGCPTRRNRWCCDELKHHGGEGKVKILGVRKDESALRKKRWKPVTLWNGSGLPGGFCVCPIVDWTDEDVWDFIRLRKIPYCSLYDEGQKRIGCVGCPMAGKKRLSQFKRWPALKRVWLNSFVEYFNKRKGKNKPDGTPYYIERFSSGEEFFDWWLSDNPSKNPNHDEACLGLYDGEFDGDQSLMTFEK